MVHLLLSNGQLACGAEGGSSSFIQLVNCGRCHAWHNTNELAKSLVGFYDYLEEEIPAIETKEGDAFDEANDDMNARLAAEFRERQNG